MRKIILTVLLALAAGGYGEGFRRPLVTLTFDDGWHSQYESARPLLKEFAYPATFYIFTDALGHLKYMSPKEVLELKSDGHEIGSHSVSHPHLNQLSLDRVGMELSESKRILEELIGGAITNFAAPYGEANARVLSEIEKYYQSNRTVLKGLNAKDDFEPYNIKTFPITPKTSLKEIEVWLDRAVKDKLWIVFCYHQVEENPPEFGVATNSFRQHLQAIRDREMTAVTVEQALKEISPQVKIKP